MANNKTTYSIPTDSEVSMASEAMEAYAPFPVQEHIVLTIPCGVDAESIRNKVNAYYTTLLHESIKEQRFRDVLDKWLDHTGVYSGPNLCWDNEPFLQIQSMGLDVIAMIDRVADSLPEYTHRHLGWLKRKLQEV